MAGKLGTAWNSMFGGNAENIVVIGSELASGGDSSVAGKPRKTLVERSKAGVFV